MAASTLQDMITGETSKQIVRRILRCYDAQQTIDDEDCSSLDNAERFDAYEAQIEECREEIFIRLYNKGLISDWTDYEGLPVDSNGALSEAIATYFAGIKHDALWVLGDGWC